MSPRMVFVSDTGNTLEGGGNKTYVILGHGGHSPEKRTPGGQRKGGQFPLPGLRHGGYTPGGMGQSMPPISISPHRMQMAKNHSLQLDLVCPSVSSLSGSTVVERKLMVLSGGQVEKVVSTAPSFVWLAGGAVAVVSGSVPKQGQPGATVRICCTKVTVVSAVTHGYVNAEPEMVVTLPVGVMGRGMIPLVRQASCRLGSSTTVSPPSVTVEAVLPVAHGKVCVVPLMTVPEGKQHRQGGTPGGDGGGGSDARERRDLAVLGESHDRRGWRY